VRGENKGRVEAFPVLASFAIVTAILYFAKAVFIPLAVAALFTFLLSPLVVRLQRWRVPKPLAIAITSGLAFALVGALTWLVVSQTLGLAEQLPRYEENLHAKVSALRGPREPGVLSRAAAIIKGIEKDLEGNDTPQPSGESTDPIAVEVKAPKPSLWQMLRRTLGPFLSPAAQAGIVVLLVLAMLIRREDLRDRFIKVISGGQINAATEAADDAARRISRYLFMNLVVNVTYGIPIGLGLHFIGVPNALLWGVLATLLRFIPFLGPWIAAAFPLMLAFAVDPGWTKLLLTISLFLVVELISNNLVEPWLYGSSTGVSPVAVIAGAVFWTWLWGPVGLFLATPLTVCIVVMGKYVPGLRFLSDLFGSQQVIEPHVRFYQRMLAMDSEEMLRLAEEHLENNDVVNFYDRVLVPALILAEEDRQTGALAEMRQKFIVQSCRDLIDELGERDREARPPSSSAGRVLCVPAGDDADELVARIVVQLLARENVPAELVPATVLPAELTDAARCTDATAVCVSALPPAALVPARRVCRRLKQNCPNLPVIVGVWSPTAAATELSSRLAGVGPDAVVTSVHNAVQQLRSFAHAITVVQPRTPAPEEQTAVEQQPAELMNLARRDAARLFDVPLSLVSILPADAEFWKRHRALPDDSNGNEPLRASSLCAQVAESSEPVAVEDVSKDKRLADDEVLEARGIRSYVAAPLIANSGHAVGSLCVLDTKPRRVSTDQLERLRDLACQLVQAIESRRSKATA
jgi:predicted PurR-regulated permease PerM/GAF domain-containing protein